MAIFGQISAKEHAYLRLALWLGSSYTTKHPVSLQFIAKQEGLSLKYMEQLIRPFVDQGWVQSVRGRSGGYQMIKDPKKLSLHDLLALFEKRPAVVSCLDAKATSRCALDTGACASKHAWAQVQGVLEMTLQKLTLGELLKTHISKNKQQSL